MKRMRVGFGATWLNNKSHMMVAGGYTVSFQVTRECEVYNVKEDKWSKIAPMLSRRTAHSICEIGKGGYVYAFGGLDEKEQNALKSIERIRLGPRPEETSANWEVLEVQLP